MPNTQIETSLRIGKAGITENVVKQVIKMLKKKKIVKVKFLPSAIKEDHGEQSSPGPARSLAGKKELFQELAEKTHSKIIHKVGFIVVLERVK